jgi:hypothetical protein
MLRQTTITDLMCDFCREGMRPGSYTPEMVPVKRVRQLAREEGWKRVLQCGRLLDMCPDCAGKDA